MVDRLPVVADPLVVTDPLVVDAPVRPVDDVTGDDGSVDGRGGEVTGTDDVTGSDGDTEVGGENVRSTAEEPVVEAGTDGVLEAVVTEPGPDAGPPDSGGPTYDPCGCSADELVGCDAGAEVQAAAPTHTSATSTDRHPPTMLRPTMCRLPLPGQAERVAAFTRSNEVVHNRDGDSRPSRRIS